jgi:hypothetical protein
MGAKPVGIDTYAATRRVQNGEFTTPASIYGLNLDYTISNNCTYHGCQCDYGLLPPPRKANFPLRHTIGASDNSDLAIIQRRDHHSPPSCPPSSSPKLPLSYQYLLSHVVSISTRIEVLGCGDYITYMNKVPRQSLRHKKAENLMANIMSSFITIALSHDFVMHSLLAWAALHVAWMTGNGSAVIASQECRSSAIRGLQDAVRTFSKENADAVLAASILLAWQAADP